MSLHISVANYMPTESTFCRDAPPKTFECTTSMLVCCTASSLYKPSMVPAAGLPQNLQQLQLALILFSNQIIRTSLQ